MSSPYQVSSIGQQPTSPYGQQPTSPYGQQPTSPYGQQPTSPYAQQPKVPKVQQPTSASQVQKPGSVTRKVVIGCVVSAVIAVAVAVGTILVYVFAFGPKQASSSSSQGGGTRSSVAASSVKVSEDIFVQVPVTGVFDGTNVIVSISIQRFVTGAGTFVMISTSPFTGLCVTDTSALLDYNLPVGYRPVSSGLQAWYWPIGYFAEGAVNFGLFKVTSAGTLTISTSTGPFPSGDQISVFAGFAYYETIEEVA